MKFFKRGIFLISVLAAIFATRHAAAQVTTTTISDTVYYADGTPAQGTILLSWNSFTTANGAAIAAGTTTVTLGSGGALTIALAPNAGSTPMGNFYTAIYHLNDGETSREYWLIPVIIPGGGPAKLAGIRNQVLPTSVAMQTVTKQYVDQQIAAAEIAPITLSSSPFVLKTGDTMTGPLVLPGDPASALQAADKHYVDENVAPVFGPSGSTHAAGMVPDPGATAGSTRYLREDGTWDAPNSAAIVNTAYFQKWTQALNVAGYAAGAGFYGDTSTAFPVAEPDTSYMVVCTVNGTGTFANDSVSYFGPTTTGITLRLNSFINGDGGTANCILTR
jgi:hypothetical protein